MCLGKFKVIRIKKIILPLSVCCFLVFLVLFSKRNLTAAKSGITLWATSIVPSLLPFFIATELLEYTGIIFYLGRFFRKIARPIFNVPGEAIFAILMGIVGGCPVGAKIVLDLKKNHILDTIESERLIAFTNNSGPLFILGTVGVSFFHSARIGFILLISHLVSSLLVGICFRWWRKEKQDQNINSFRYIRSSREIRAYKFRRDFK